MNPLRTLLNEEIDFERLKASSPIRLLIAATRVSDGRARIFDNAEINAEVVLASSCLPLFHHAVTIDDIAYWDGGYSANPPLVDLVSASQATDLLVVRITPTLSAETPTSSREILRRLDQITFKRLAADRVGKRWSGKSTAARNSPACCRAKAANCAALQSIRSRRRRPSTALPTQTRPISIGIS